MIPRHELLNRIRWDKKFAQGQFEIGYYDHREDKIIHLSFDEIVFEPNHQFSITTINSEGETHMVPYHRIKEVYKDGKLIWHRSH